LKKRGEGGGGGGGGGSAVSVTRRFPRKARDECIA